MKLRAVIIGVGRMGRRHIQVLRELDLDLVGIFDQSSESLHEAKLEHNLGESLLFDNYEALYARGVPDCAIIATTAESHCRLVCDAAKRGVKLILVEKPLATSLLECDRMISICTEHGVRLAVNHQMRFMEEYKKPKELLSSTAYGGLKSMTVVSGNMGVSMNGTHYFEAFRFMSEDDPYEVTAWFSPDLVANPRGPQFTDRAGSIRLTTASGKRLYLEMSSDQGHGLFVVYAGRNGTITVNELSGEIITSVRTSQFADLPTTRYSLPSIISHDQITTSDIIGSTSNVLKALINGEDSMIGRNGRAAIEILVAAYTSAENGSIPVRVDDRLDRKRVFPWA